MLHRFRFMVDDFLYLGRVYTGSVFVKTDVGFM